MNIILITVFMTFMVMLIFWTSFRNWIGRQLGALWVIAQAYFPNIWNNVRNFLGLYSIVLVITAVISLVLIILGLLVPWPGFTAFAFVLACMLILLAWLPAGIILRVFRINTAVVPQALKVFIAWIAFLGFLAMVFPELVSFTALMGVALVALISLGLTAKMNFLDKVIWPLVVVMLLTIGWKHFFPESFRSTVRYTQSWSKRITTLKDRGSINNEMDAATTYAVVLMDTRVLYVKNGEQLDVVDHPLTRGTIVRLVNHKSEVFVYEGQGLVEIQLSTENETFINGRRYWIEAEFVQIASPRDIVPRDDSLLPKNQQAQSSSPQQSQPLELIVLGPGTHRIKVLPGEPSELMQIRASNPMACGPYSFQSPRYNYEIWFTDGDRIIGGRGIMPHKVNPIFRLFSQTGDEVTIIVI